jgi:hypothetical protein
MEEKEYRSLLWKLIDDKRREKIKRFYNLLAEGKEFYYDPLQDKLYADLNLTLTDKHLAMIMLEYLNKEIAEKARRIMSHTEISKRSRVASIARLVKGITIPEMQEASERAAEDVNIAEYIVEDIRNLKPTRLVIFTDTPRITVEIFKERKINPLYNSSGSFSYITVYATELEQKDGILTGNILYIPDELERHNIRTLDHLLFLKKNLELIS